MSEVQEPPKVTPQSLVSKDLLRAALKADKGDDAELLSCEVKDFTKKGDNYACVVTSGIVQYHLGDQEKREVTYIVKCNPCRGDIFAEFSKMVFTKEAEFYNKIVPLINAELQAIGQEPLRLPACYKTHLIEGKEIIILKDLRPDDFKMFDRKKGMDAAHVTLVQRELARLHAASTLAQAKMSEPMEVTYDFLLKDFDSINMPNGENMFDTIFSTNMQTTSKMLEKVGGYNKAVDWLNTHAKQATDMFKDCNKRIPPFEVVCHGDCWNNNILFKYDETGKPVDLRLLDLQICRKASLATDLNYLMYTSLEGSMRKENLQAFLKTYHDTFSDVLSAAGKTMPFTLDELKKEYHKLNLFGFLMSLMVVPVVVSEGQALDFDNMTGDMEKDVEKFQTMMLEQINNNPLLKPRLLDTFDDMLEYGVIS